MHFYRKDSTLESSSCFKWYNSFEFDTNQGNKYFLHLCYREQFKQMHWNSWLTLDYRQYQLKIQGCSVTDVLWGFKHTSSSVRGKGTAKPHNFFPKKLKIHSFSASYIGVCLSEKFWVHITDFCLFSFHIQNIELK